MSNKNSTAIAGLAISVLGFLFAALACGLEAWVTLSIFGYNVDVGIWKSCIKSICVNIDSNVVSEKVLWSIKAIRAMTLLGILFSAAAIACGIVAMFDIKQKKILYSVVSTLNFQSGSTMMTAFSVAIDRVKPAYPDYSFGAAFYLDIMAFIFTWIAAGLFVKAIYKNKTTNKT